MASRDSFIQRMHAEIDKLDARIEEIQAKLKREQARGREEYAEQLAELHERRDEARSRLVEMQKAAEGSWEELKTGFERAYRDLAQSVDRAVDRFR